MAVDTAELCFSTRGGGDVVDFTGEAQGPIEEIGATSGHQRATLIGPSETVPIFDGRLALGAWQQLVLLDFDDRLRERTVVVQVTY